jgi:2-polyprenyl-6-methoxyphenol hydroxylase-like FAD-dependent oxidoreductase
MAHIGIIGSGIAGLQLGLELQQHGIETTIYSERTPEQQLERRLSNMVARNGCTRERERQLCVNHWDAPSHDMLRLSVCVRGSRRIVFSGCMGAPAQAVDMRIYWARLLEDYSTRGGRVVIRTLQSDELDDLASQHDLLVVASGRASLSSSFPRVAAHSPYTSPQRLAIAGLFRGIRYSEPRALEVIVTPGSGEILAVPFQSFEPDLTGICILITGGGQFEPLRHQRYEVDPRAFVAAVLGLLREHAPSLYDRTDAHAFDLSRPLDLGYAAITPTVRRGFVELSNRRHAIAIGDAHVVIDPITGQGANSASYAASVLCRAIRTADAFDRPFCQRVEQEICAYVVPVSDAANARLQPPTEHFRELLGAAARDQAIADVYAHGYNHPDWFWAIASSAERTADLLRERGRQGRSSALAS